MMHEGFFSITGSELLWVCQQDFRKCGTVNQDAHILDVACALGLYILLLYVYIYSVKVYEAPIVNSRHR